MSETITEMPPVIPAAAGIQQLSMQQALNRALDEVLAQNPKTVIFGEDCGRLEIVFACRNTQDPGDGGCLMLIDDEHIGCLKQFGHA